MTARTLIQKKARWIILLCSCCCLLTPLNLIDDRQIPIEALSSTTTPRASNFSQEQTHVMTDSSTERTASPALPAPELIPDISPIVLRGREGLSTRSVREELPARPLSTPPRMNSYTEAGRPGDKVRCRALV